MSKIFEALNKGQRESLELVEIRAEPLAADRAPAAPPADAAAPERPAIHAAPERPAIHAAPEPPAIHAASTPHAAPERPVIHAAPERPVIHAASEPPAIHAAANAAPEAAFHPAPAAAPRIRKLALHLAAQSPVLPFDGGQARASEQYRIARTRILQDPHAPRIILLSSPGPRDGKTTTAINLAGALSLRAGFNVLLVDGDFRRSTVHTALGLPAGPGLAEVLSGVCPLDEALIHVEEFPNLYVLPAGHCQGNPAELLDSAQWVALQATLKRRFRSVVIDSPPIAAVADYELLLAGAEGVILVVRLDHTGRQAALDAIQALPKEKFMGVLLNCVQPWFLGKGQSYSDSYYYEKAAG